MSSRPRSLLVDDDSQLRSATIALLCQDLPDLQIDQISNAEGFAQALEAGGFNLVITDYQLGWTNGLAILQAVKARYPSCPVIMFTGTGSEEIAVEAMKAGLTDYVLKAAHHFIRLPAAVRAALQQSQEHKALRETEARYRNLFDCVPVGLYQSTPDGQILDANPAMVEMLGYPSRESLLAVTADTLYVNPEDRYYWQSLLERDWVVVNYECRLRRRDSTVIWVEDTARVIRDAHGLAQRYEGSLEDISKRKRAEEALQRAESQYRELVESVNAIVWQADARTFQFTYVSNQAESLLGYPVERWTQEPTFWQDHIHPDDREWAIAYCMKALQEKRLYEFEYRMLAADGRAVWIRDIAHIEVEGDRPTRLIGLIVDITERKQAEDTIRKQEEQLRQSQKMEAIGRLSAGVAHDFNNLLMTIMGYSDLILNRLGPNDPFRTEIEEIRKAGKRAALLTSQLLAFGRKQVLQPKALHLNAVVTQMDSMLHPLTGEHIQLVTTLDPSLGWIKADQGQIEQVIVNLVLNAREAMPQGGTLTISTANAVLNNAVVEQLLRSTPGAYVTLTVSDTGVGMDAYAQEHCFEPFFSTKGAERGVGLGLSTVYGIVKQSGGQIEVASEPGRGSTFTIYLPRIEASAGNASTGASPAERTSGAETILLVEDELMVRGVVRGMLEALGYKVLEASNGQEALQVCGEHHGTIHLLLTDVVMPEIHGPELADRVVALRPGTRVLFMSGYTDHTKLQHGVPTEGMAFIQKPFSPETLARKLREVLGANQ